jgi:hypothetical protein
MLDNFPASCRLQDDIILIRLREKNRPYPFPSIFIFHIIFGERFFTYKRPSFIYLTLF